MKREKRPFTVEVKRGQKRPLTLSEAAVDGDKQDSLRRAEETLFGGAAGDSALLKAEAPARRILEAVAPEAPAILAAEPPRRGRKPGSKNKSKAEAAAPPAGAKRGRGRPPRNPESQVRRVPITPEITSAAIFTMSRVSPAAPMSPVPGGRMTPVPIFEAPPKRKRGRPRKIREPKFDWTVWSSDEPLEFAAEAAAAPLPAVPAAAAGQIMDLPPLSGLTRYDGPRLRSGERWKRRLRIPGGGPAKPRAQSG